HRARGGRDYHRRLFHRSGKGRLCQVSQSCLALRAHRRVRRKAPGWGSRCGDRSGRGWRFPRGSARAGPFHLFRSIGAQRDFASIRWPVVRHSCLGGVPRPSHSGDGQAGGGSRQRLSIRWERKATEPFLQNDSCKRPPSGGLLLLSRTLSDLSDPEDRHAGSCLAPRLCESRTGSLFSLYQSEKGPRGIVTIRYVQKYLVTIILKLSVGWMLFRSEGLKPLKKQETVPAVPERRRLFPASRKTVVRSVAALLALLTVGLVVAVRTIPEFILYRERLVFNLLEINSDIELKPLD